MSVLAALQDMFAVPELTVPVTLGAAHARGFYDQNGSTIAAGGIDVQVTGPVLFLPKDALAGLTEQVVLTIGDVGAADAVGGAQLMVHRIDPIQDGLVVACHLGGGR